MEGLSKAQGRIRASPTVAIATLAQELRAAGRDVIALAAGEPDFDTPENIRAAAMRAIEAGRTRYTAPDGMPALKAAVAAKLRRDNGLDYDPAQITVANGGKQVLFNALLASLDPGDEVIVPAPFWVSYPDMVRLADARPVLVGTRPEEGYRITPQALAAAITPRSRWLILNSPGNPSGAGYDAAALAALAAVLRRHQRLWVLSDDIYEHLSYPPFRFASLAAVAPDLAGRILLVNGVSKAHAMTGWRIGYGAGPEPLIAAMRKIQSQSTGNPCTISQWAALEALEGPQAHIRDRLPIFRRRRDLVVEMLNAAEGISCPTPEGAFYVYPSIAGCIGRTSPGGRRIDSDEAFVTALLEETGVAVVFGAAFGLSPHFRLSYAAAEESLREGCERIQSFCAGLR